MKRIIVILLSFLINAGKGLLIPVGAHKTWDRWAPSWGGFRAPMMKAHWDRLRMEGWSMHNLTNIVVEWNRLDAQRGAKFMMGFAAVGWILAILT